MKHLIIIAAAYFILSFVGCDIKGFEPNTWPR